MNNTREHADVVRFVVISHGVMVEVATLWSRVESVFPVGLPETVAVFSLESRAEIPRINPLEFALEIKPQANFDATITGGIIAAKTATTTAAEETKKAGGIIRLTKQRRTEVTNGDAGIVAIQHISQID